MSSVQFVFDVVVSHLDTPKIKVVDPKRLEVTAQFNNKPVTITSSRINVTEFNANKAYEFNSVPKKLKKTLEDCGMPVQLKYNGRIVGTGQISFPQMVIDRIEEGMSDLMHVDTCNIEKEGEVLGSIEILCRLVVKCAEQPMEESVCRRNMDSSIAQQDIMFVITGSQRCPSPCDPCLDALAADEGDYRLGLDLQRYHSLTHPLKSDKVFTHSPASNAACCEIKNLARECEDIVDSITKAAGHPKPLKAPCRRPDDVNSSCLITDHMPIKENPLTSPRYPCFSYLPARIDDPPDFCSPNLIPVPIGDQDKPMIRPSRFCPICLTNMSWMPKFAACPTCGVKPMPVLEERHKEKKLTASQILFEYLGKPNGAAEDLCLDPCNKLEDKEESRCRCTCKFGQLCAHCRIRKLVADIFKATQKEQVCTKVKPKNGEDFCVLENDPTECRPYLGRVFSELRDLYNLQDTAQTNPEHPVSRIPTKNRPKIRPVENLKRIVPRTAKPVKRLFYKSKTGHKTCLHQSDLVAHNQGWAWHLSPEATKHGWRPGLVHKTVKKIINFFAHYSPENSPRKICEREQEAELETERQLPTLNLCKKDGEIFVTLRSINDPNVRQEPIVFKIVKSPLAVITSKMKEMLKAKGFTKCTCHQPLMMCVCRDNEEKKRLESAVAKESRRQGFESCVDQLVLTDTSESGMEYDFDVSPPAASSFAKPASSSPNLLKRNRSTQTLGKKYLKVTRKYPVPLNPYYRTYDCAAGDRYTGTALGAPGESVFEDGVFGFRGGGPHGAAAAPGGRGKPAAIWGRSPGGPVRGGAAFSPGGKGFPGAKKDHASKVKSPPIPVRMTDKHYKAIEKAKKDEKEAIKKAVDKKKKGTDIIKYLEQKGTVPTPWDPNNPKPKNPRPPKPKEGPDGLTDAQRKRRHLLEMPVPPLDSMPRLGRCPGSCYNPCHGECCYPCGYYC